MFRFVPPDREIQLSFLQRVVGPPPTPAGEFFPEARPLALSYQIFFGESRGEAQGFLAANSIGLCQFNVVVPSVPGLDIRIDARIDGVFTDQGLFTTIQR